MDKIYTAYLAWRARPLAKDDPILDEEAFCKKFKVTKTDIKSFVTRETFQDDLLTASLNWAKSKTPELLHLVYNEVKLSKSVADLERFVQLIHEIKKRDEKNKNITNYNFFTNIKDDQYRNIIRREADGLDRSIEAETVELLPTTKS